MTASAPRSNRSIDVNPHCNYLTWYDQPDWQHSVCFYCYYLTWYEYPDWQHSVVPLLLPEVEKVRSFYCYYLRWYKHQDLQHSVVLLLLLEVE